ncbi:hypothetical protein ACJIZ3_019885 [Penstemon smallii]|uniref:Uncharacterized protein n=1 Tax=Penstemon smallii TaxID=265156 RepID=A0ABD3T364_9LAMI
MPMTRTQRADYTAQYGGLSPHERAFFLNRLYEAASQGEIHEVADLMGVIQGIATQMNENFQPRHFTLTALRNMLHRLRLDYVDFCQFLENPWVDYDPFEVKVPVRAPYWQTINPHPPSYRRYRLHWEPNYTRLRMIFDIKRCAILPLKLLEVLNGPSVIRNTIIIYYLFSLPIYIKRWTHSTKYPLRHQQNPLHHPRWLDLYQTTHTNHHNTSMTLYACCTLLC